MNYREHIFRKPRQLRLVAVALTCALAATMLVLSTSSGRASGTKCTLTIERVLFNSPEYATRAAKIDAEIKSASKTVHYAFEYATSKEGPWYPAGSGTSTSSNFEGAVGQFGAAISSLHHLLPDTAYFGRLIVENGCATALKSFEFKTTTVSAPEVRLTINQIEGGSLTEFGMTYADYEAEIEGNGAATKYQFEVRKPGEAWPGVPAAGTGTSGSLTGTGAEDYVVAQAHMTGVEPETAYEVRVIAKNGLGEGEGHESFHTAPEHPGAFVSYFEGVNATSVQIQGSVGPRSSEARWNFEYATSESGPWTVGPSGTIPAPSVGEPVQAGEENRKVGGELTGLASGTVYYVRLHTENGHPPAATSNVGSIETGGKPVVLTFATHTYVPGGATVRVLGSIEPHGVDTHYHFQYVSQEDFEVSGWVLAASTGEKDAGTGAYQGEYPTAIYGEDVPGLQPGKQYRYRLVASSAEGTVDGAEEAISVPVPAPVEELVCPNEAFRGGPSAHLPDCRAYELVTPADKEGSMDNWTYSGNVSTPVAVGEDGEHAMVKAEYSKWGPNADAQNSAYFFTRESTGWGMRTATPQPQAGSNSYRPQVFSANLSQVGVSVGYSSTLLTGGLSPDLELMAGPQGGPYTLVLKAPRSTEPKWVASSPDAGTLILSKAGKLSEWSGGELRQIYNCPATMSEAADGGSPGGAVSTNGSRIFFEAPSGSECTGSTHLFMRVDATETVDLGAYQFLAANSTGSELLVEATGQPTHEYLAYDTTARATKPLFSSLHEQLHVLASRDMSSIYVIAKEQLVPEAPLVSVASENAGGFPVNVYRYDMGEGKLRFVIQTTLTNRYVSADGRYYYWTSSGTAGVFSENGQFGSLEEQTYRYDANEKTVECISCVSAFDPRPKMMSQLLSEDIENPVNGSPQAMVASDNGDYVFFVTASALLPVDTDGELYAGTTNYFTEEHDFFYSPSTDVYEWRKNGVDGCSHVQGCVALISSGTDGLKNVLLGTTPSGRDIFFATHSQLVGQDSDGQGDLYDARIGGGYPPPPPPSTECDGDACVTPASAPVDTTPASLSFSGPGNLASPVVVVPGVRSKAKPCKRGMVRSKGRCVKRKRPRAKRSRYSGRVSRAHKARRGGHR